MNFGVTLSFVCALGIYLFIAGRDIIYHYSLDGTSTAVPVTETILHFICGSLVTLILGLLIFSDVLPISLANRNLVLAVAPIALTVTGLVDEFAFHRPRCRKDPVENWNHAVLHLSMGSTLVLAYVRWF